MTIQGSLTRKELMVLYNRGEGVIRRWLKEADINHRRSLTPNDLQKLFARVGEPKKICQ